METPKTLLDAIQFFEDAENCRLFMIATRWADGIVRCPRCGSSDVSYMPNAKQYHCKAKHEKSKFSLKVGTIFEDSPIGLEKWLPAAWLISNCKNGISSYEIARALGVTQKSAWHMLHRLREAMKEEGDEPLSGMVEMDETFIGGKITNMHKNKKPKGKGFTGKLSGVQAKTIVVGMVERGGRVRAEVVVERTKEVLHEIVYKNLGEGSTLVTDEWGGYVGVNFEHAVVNHAIEYVNGLVHTNGIENFWSLLKRGLGGTYISVEPFHLFRYIDEQAFRYNNRKDMNDGARFVKVLSQIVGKRLTYAELTGKASLSPA
jgi:transposase-like protein